MARMPHIFLRTARLIERHRGLIFPAALVGMLLVVLLPLPPALLDVLLVANLAAAAIILLTAVLAGTPLEFNLFPTVLLASTLGRLVLGLAATRLILTCGQGGLPPQEAASAAGSIVAATGSLLAGGSPAAGLAVFGLLLAIQILVLTKGAGRVCEVAARFALDAMPGKQMAIDSDCASGLLHEEQAHARRLQASQEADFYGAMDGAAKFLRGDAVAAILFAAVNLLGGLYVGLREYHWSWPAAAEVFTPLAVGAGLMTLVPAMLVSIAATVLVGRSATRTDLGEEAIAQLLRRPVVLALAAAMVAGLLLTPLPKAPLLLVLAGLAGGAWALRGRSARTPVAAQSVPAEREAPAEEAANLLRLDPMRIDLGYALVRLAEGRDLMERIASLRARLAREMGFLLPPVRIRDDMRLEPGGYAIYIRSARVAAGKMYPHLLLAVGEGAENGQLTGTPTQEPLFGAPAVWIRPEEAPHAQRLSCAVIGPAGVLLTHLEEVVRTHAGELLTREQTARLLENLRKTSPVVVQEATDKLKVGQVQRVLQDLLREQVPIRDLETILEAVSEAADHTREPAALAERARAVLSRTLSQQYCCEDGRLWCVSLRPELEEAIGRYVGTGPLAAEMPPETHQKLARAVAQGLSGLESQGRPPVVVCAPGVRAAVRRLLAPSLPRAVVLGYNEIDSVAVETVANIGTEP